MCREEQHCVCTFIFWELSKSRLDILRDGLVGWVGNAKQRNRRGRSTHLDETGVGAPSVNDAPVDAREKPSLAFAEYVVETAACRATAILGILRKGYRACHAVLLHASCGLLCERSYVAERDVALVRRRGRMELVEQCRHTLPLQFGPAQNGGTAANVHVLLLDARSPSFGDPWCYDRLERKGDKVPV